MKSRIVCCLLLAVMAVAGCGPTSPARTGLVKKFNPGSPAPSQIFSTAVRTLLPATQTSSVTKTPAASPAPAYPVSTEPAPTQVGNPYPAPQVTTPGLMAQAAAPAPFKDCARTPGLVGCAAQNPPLKGYLAFYESTSPSNQLYGVDLETGQGWQTGISPPPGWLSWSGGGTSGEQLLVSLGSGQYEVIPANGGPASSFQSETPPAWQSGGKLSLDGTVRSETGAEARLEQDKNMQWLLHVRTEQGEQKTFPLAANPGDTLYVLRDWVPGGQALLAQSYFASNQAMIQGGRLVILDASTGAIQTLQAMMPLNGAPDANFAWDPAQPGLLAFLETSETSVMAPRLALWNAKTGHFSFPLPENLAVNSLTWNPNGKLDVAVRTANNQTSPNAQQDFSGSGIYEIDPKIGKVAALVLSQGDGIDTWPQWTADGKTLIYAHGIGSGEGLQIQVRARRVSDGKEWVLVEGLSFGMKAVEPGFAQKILAFGRK